MCAYEGAAAVGRTNDGKLAGKAMKDLCLATPSTFANVRFVLTDMDETLTYRGRLSARTYGALERLQRAGVRVIPVTAAPSGWCDQMARMWPVDGVVSENGGLFIQSDGGHGVKRSFWHAEAKRQAISDQLAKIGGLDVTVSNIWSLSWIGAYDKLAMARRVMADVYGIDIDSDRDAILYCGDSANDAPMFGFFRHTVGVSTVRHYLPDIPIPPNWITKGPGGDGFVEVADAVIAGKTGDQ